jgi:hypothetical protein
LEPGSTGSDLRQSPPSPGCLEGLVVGSTATAKKAESGSQYDFDSPKEQCVQDGGTCCNNWRGDYHLPANGAVVCSATGLPRRPPFLETRADCF